MSIDTTKYWHAMRGVSQDAGKISIDAAIICVNLAVREQDQQACPPSVWLNAYEQMNAVLQWMDGEGHGFDGDMLSTIKRVIDAEKANDINRDWKTLAHDLEHMLNDARADSSKLSSDLEELQAAANAECAGLRKSIREQDATIQAQRAEINRLTAHCQDLTAQLEAANSRPVTLSVQAAPAPFPAGDLAVALADYATSGDGREDLTFTYDNSPTPVDWAGLPDEYRHLVNLLVAGERQWTDIAVPGRRSIALSVINRMATDGALTMAEFDGSRPPYMPTAAAMVQMFGIRWSSIVKNAVSHA